MELDVEDEEESEDDNDDDDKTEAVSEEMVEEESEGDVADDEVIGDESEDDNVEDDAEEEEVADEKCTRPRTSTAVLGRRACNKLTTSRTGGTSPFISANRLEGASLITRTKTDLTFTRVRAARAEDIGRRDDESEVDEVEDTCRADDEADDVVSLWA